MNWITYRNHYIRAKAYRHACDTVGFVKVQKHDSWADAAGNPNQFYTVTERHPDFEKVRLAEVKRLRARMVVA